MGGLRLLTTWASTRLNYTFPESLPEGKRIEVRRSGIEPLSIDRAADIQIGPKRTARAAAALGLGINEFAARLGLTGPSP